MASAEFAKWWDGFRASGNIAPIALGISREELLAFFGEPDDEARGILKYGRLEFHFGDGLSLIYADDDFGVVETCIRPLLTSQSDCRWFAVQCILQHPKVTTDFLYEERITICALPTSRMRSHKRRPTQVPMLAPGSTSDTPMPLRCIKRQHTARKSIHSCVRAHCDRKTI
jgi:hypothetical protein